MREKKTERGHFGLFRLRIPYNAENRSVGRDPRTFFFRIIKVTPIAEFLRGFRVFKTVRRGTRVVFRLFRKNF